MREGSILPTSAVMLAMFAVACVPDGPGPSPAPVVDAGADAAFDSAPARRCDPAKGFDPPQPQSDIVLPAASILGGLTFTGDELTAYFASDAPRPVTGTRPLDIFFVKRASKSTQFGVPALVGSGVSLADAVEPHAMPTNDGKQLYFARFGATGGIFKSTVTADGFAAPQLVLGNKADGYAFTPWIRADQTAMYYSAGDPTFQFSYLYKKQLNPLALGTALTELNQDGKHQQFPILSGDEKRIYFASNRTDSIDDSVDIWTATRPNAGDQFSGLVRVESLSTAGDEFPTWLSEDTCVLAVTRASKSKGDYQLFIAKKPL
jgi:hypothetical protein